MSEHPGLEFAPPPNAAFPNFTLDAPSSVIYNLYGRNMYTPFAHSICIRNHKYTLRFFR